MIFAMHISMESFVAEPQVIYLFWDFADMDWRCEVNQPLGKSIALLATRLRMWKKNSWADKGKKTTWKTIQQESIQFNAGAGFLYLKIPKTRSSSEAGRRWAIILLVFANFDKYSELNVCWTTFSCISQEPGIIVVFLLQQCTLRLMKKPSLAYVLPCERHFFVHLWEMWLPFDRGIFPLASWVPFLRLSTFPHVSQVIVQSVTHFPWLFASRSFDGDQLKCGHVTHWTGWEFSWTEIPIICNSSDSFWRTRHSSWSNISVYFFFNYFYLLTCKSITLEIFKNPHKKS